MVEKTPMLRAQMRRRILYPALVLALVPLAACIRTPSEIQEGMERAEWALVQQQDSWVNMPGTTLVVERRYANITEQRTLLPNRTSLPGDNFAHLRAVPRSDGGLLSLERVLERSGGLPPPFAKDDLNAMRSRDDAAGTLNWSEWSDGAGTNCVLAIRRMPIGVRVLPFQAIALDMVMRNCVRGDAAAALAPAGSEFVAFGAPYGVSRGAKQRNLSPLAAPQP
jgi:hypothetical protein